MRLTTKLVALGLALAVCLSTSPLRALTPPGRSTALVPAAFRPVTDSRGVAWSTTPTGAINTNNGSLQNAGFLTVAGNAFNSTRSEMTSDGQTFVLTGRCGNVEVTRRIQFDSLSCAASFVETVTNPGPQDLQVEINLGVPIRYLSGYYSDTGMASPATLDAQSTGLIAYSRMRRNTGTAWWLCSAKARVKPSGIANQSGRYLQATYRVPLSSGAKISIMHGLGEFLTAPMGGPQPATTPTDRQALAKFMTVCDVQQWIHDLPSDVRRTLVNAGSTPAIEPPKGNLPASLAAALERANLERGVLDILAVDADSTVEGTARSKNLRLTCPRGQVELNLDDVSLISGGAGRGRSATVYLRNGEVLVGELAADEFVLTNDAGLKIDLAPAQMTSLAMHLAPAELHPDESIVALATLDSGERLALRSEPEQKLTVVTAWGAAKVAWDQLQSLAYEQTPQPAFRVVFADRSRLSVLLSGPEIELETTRWGTVKVAARELRRWDSTRPATPAARSEEASADEGNDLPGPFVRMAGENVLAAAPAESMLHLATATGTRTLETSQIEHMAREDDGTFRCELADGSTLTGSLQEPRVSVRWHEQSFQIPVRQVIGLRGAADKREQETARGN